MWKRTTIPAIYILLIMSLMVSSCSFIQLQPKITYDPDKTYAAFLVLDSDTGRATLETMKQHTLADNLEIGPIEYYSPGTKDFEPILTRLTASKQIKVVWIISMVLDVPQIKTAMSKLAYEGTYRYVPIMNGTPMKIQQ